MPVSCSLPLADSLARRLKDLAPDPEEASKGTTLLIDGTLAPCWSWKNAPEPPSCTPGNTLGANTFHLTPIFPARSNSRDDASSFDRVDPVLGGDEALARLTAAAHARGMRVMGDFTTNHCGHAHEWFRTVIADASSPEAGFFLFYTHPTENLSWFDCPSLPKFDHRNPELRRRLYEGPDSIVARWLTPPAALDGWRIDVAK